MFNLTKYTDLQVASSVTVDLKNVYRMETTKTQTQFNTLCNQFCILTKQHQYLYNRYVDSDEKIFNFTLQRNYNSPQLERRD